MANPSLIDKLREVADFIPVSHIPSLNEIAKVVGALAVYVEHGDNLFQIAEKGAEGVHNLISPAQEGAPPSSAASGFAPDVPTPTPAASAQRDVEAENQALRQQVANLEAASRATQGTVEPDADDVPPPPAPSAQAPVSPDVPPPPPPAST